MAVENMTIFCLDEIPLQPNEKIKMIKGYEWKYSITDHGRVWSHTRDKGNTNAWNSDGMWLKNTMNTEGYHVVTLHRGNNRKQAKVHRLVLEAFDTNPENKSTVNHIDHDRTNNHIDNLEWMSYSENISNSYPRRRLS